MIKGIVFDMGGVLVDIDFEACLNAFHDDCGFERISEFLDPCNQRGFFQKMESGQASEEEFIDEVLTYCRPGTSRDAVRESFWKLITVIPQEKIDLMRELSQKYPLYMLSNNNPVVMPHCRRIFRNAGVPMEEIFKELFVSCDMKMMKPNPEIFEEAIRRTGFKAEELIFVDDSERNAEAGRQAGMRSLFYERGTDLRKLLESVLD